MKRRLWTPEEDALLRELYPEQRGQDVAAALGRSLPSMFERARKLGIGKSETFWSSDRSGRVQRGHQDPRMVGTQFQKGDLPWNTGTKGVAGQHPNSRSHQFRPGSRNGRAAERYQPIGAERIFSGYLQRKVNDDLPLQARWQFVHRMIWEAAHGPIPPGHLVVFKPGTHTTEAAQIHLENLELVSRAENMRRNTYHNKYPKEIGLLIQLRGALNRKINRKEKAREEQD